MADVLSTRLEPAALRELQAEAARRGVPVSLVAKERLTGAPTPRAPEAPVLYAGQWNTHEELRAYWTTWKGKLIANLRVWYDRGGGEWRAGKHGMMFSASRLRLVSEAVNALLAELESPAHGGPGGGNDD